jgi:hypothetical protein
MMQRALALITMIALLMSGWSQASVSCHVISEPLTPVVDMLESSAAVMPCHQQAEAESPAPVSVIQHAAGCGDACDACADCVITGSASGLMHDASATLALRQDSLMMNAQALVVSLVLPLPDRPPITS